MFTAYQKFVIAILAFLQFTVVLDFMILSPLGAVVMPALQITPAQFGMVVSGYAFSAGISGFLAAGFADRFDRKRLLLFFYFGFVLGTLLCGLAHTYEFLFFARVITGLFGGVIGSITFAITTDLFPYEQRGRVMGIVQTSFSASQILGIPAGLFLSNHFGWSMPFFMIVLVSFVVGIAIVLKLQPITTHLATKADRTAFRHLLATVSDRRYLQGFATMALLTVGGFMMMPFGSAFMVNNLGVSLADLPVIYVVTGACSIIVGPWVGRLADKIGKYRVFFIGCLITMILVNIYTHLGAVSLTAVIVINAVMFAGVFMRIIASSAMMSGLPRPSDRGAYMAVSSSLQQVSGGIASVVGGMIVVQQAGGKIEHFDVIGYVLTGSTLLTLVMAYYIDRHIRGHHH